MKKFFIFILLSMMIYSFGFLKVNATSLPSGGSAVSAILMEKDTKRILYEKNIDQRHLTASIAKIMTAIVAIEHGKLDEYCEVNVETTKQIGSSIYLQLGDKVKLIDLIHGLMMRSGNDAAYLIAVSVADDYDKFVYLMNETAKRIGMTSSTFSNPSGLDEKSLNYSTAHDMALLMAYALDNEIFRKITSSKTYKSESANGNLLYFVNKHRLIQTEKYVTGGKTGYTTNANRTLVTSAMKDGMELIVVTLNSGRDDWNVHKQLFDFGFNNYQMFTVLKKQIIKVNNYLYKATPIIFKDIKYPVAVNEKAECVIHLLKRPLDNLVIGKAVIYLDGKEVYYVDIYRYY